jgi:Cu(I)/Ag(I) efflux system membrane fusion protein
MTKSQEGGKSRSFYIWVAAIAALAIVAGGVAYFSGHLGWLVGGRAKERMKGAAMEAPSAGEQHKMAETAPQGKGKILYWQSSMNPKETYNHPGKDKMGMELVPVYEGKETGEKPKMAEAGPQGKGKILYWQSSMNPTEIYKAPGKDTMGMELVPVYEGEETMGAPGTVKIDPVTIQNIGVKTVVIQRKRLMHEIRTVGRIVYDEKKVRQISPKIEGWVERQYVNFDGQLVEEGESLLEIYSPELVSAQEEYLIAVKYLEGLKTGPQKERASGSENLLRAAETRLRYWDISEGQIKALRERGQITRTMVLHAPFKGIIVRKDVLEGGYVKSGQVLYSIADLSTVWVYADIYEYEAPWLRLGQEAVMTLAYQPGASYRGKVTYIYPYLKNMTRTLQVRMEFSNNKDFLLKPDMWADVTLRSAVAREGLAVPIQAVIRTGKRDIALVALQGGRFEPRDLRLGPQAGDEFEVLKGLKEGERVVTSAQFLINSESNLQAALGKMLEPKAQEGQPEGQTGHSMPPAAPSKRMPGMPPGKPSPPHPSGHPGKE